MHYYKIYFCFSFSFIYFIIFTFHFLLSIHLFAERSVDIWPMQIPWHHKCVQYRANIRKSLHKICLLVCIYARLYILIPICKLTTYKKNPFTNGRLYILCAWLIWSHRNSVRRRTHIVTVMRMIEIRKRKRCTMIYVQYRELVDRRYFFINNLFLLLIWFIFIAFVLSNLASKKKVHLKWN